MEKGIDSEPSEKEIWKAVEEIIAAGPGDPRYQKLKRLLLGEEGGAA